ncbi:MAG: valine--tRNA ligase [Nanohaloarchaea archaeon]|nr:valine--tRNA ligase [Candidatus Nanohaloarchaea archaeon]
MVEGDYNAGEVEEKWQQKWEENKVYRYQGGRDSDKKEVFSIDTPPPTVSGNLHFGHVYGNTLADFQARFQRMRGKEVYFPFGHDNNGIASERLTERELGIKHQDFERKEFQEKVREVCEKYQNEFEEGMRSFGFSMDWDNTYTTIDPKVQKISQLSFIDLYEKGREYRKKAPAIWCPECETAISQVETEDDEQHSHFNDIEFPLASGNGSVMISTTRPELLPACVAIFVHPNDESNDHLVGEKAEVPLFDREVPIIEDEGVDMETGTGVVMCCTFGDQNDIEWYQKHDLDLKVAIDETGTMTELAEKYEGMSTEEAREEIIEDLEAEDYLMDQRDITHTVQVHERCGSSLEFMVSEQWYVKLLDKKEEYLEAGKEMDWNPEKMFTRYKNWIEGLQWDWCISRQRDSGIPFPVWYCEGCGEEIIADKSDLPVDPLSDEPPVAKCPECDSTDFEPEDDVFDTWATSSLTPMINADLQYNEEIDELDINKEELYPMNLRYQGHDIISFWLFHTVIKCLEHTGEVPFEEVQINGMILDENRRKMSKSKGNVTTPEEVTDEFSVDAARYWGANASVGDDLAMKTDELKSGEKLMRKLWNASKLVEQIGNKNMPDIEEEDLDEVDRWIIGEADAAVEEVTERMENYDYSKARDSLRVAFWHKFCDDYLEIAKQRLDEETDLSTVYALKVAHKKFLKMFAPFMPHITEEIWRDMYSESSIHRSKWPEPEHVDAELEKGENAMEVISGLRKFKTQNQMSPTAELETVKVFGEIRGFTDAIKEVMHVENLEILTEEPETEKQIVEIKLDYSKAGPKFGDDIGEIEAALEDNEWHIDAGMLEAADHHIPAEMYEVHEQREFKGEGEMIETENSVVIVE